MNTLARFSDRTGDLNHLPASVHFTIDDSMIGESLMNYEKIYSDFISDRRAKPEPSCYTESHHIIPRSMNGGDGEDNLIRLTAGDHYFGHLCLAKIHGGAMWASVNMTASMLPTSNRTELFSKRRMVAIAREKYSSYLSKKMTGSGNHRYGKTTPDDVRKKLSNAMKGKLAGKKNGMYGKKASPETLAKMSDSVKKGCRRGLRHHQYGKPISDDVKNKISDTARKNGSHKKKVMCVETGQVFLGAVDAVRAGYGSVHICSVCKGNRPTAGGYHWKYA